LAFNEGDPLRVIGLDVELTVGPERRQKCDEIEELVDERRQEEEKYATEQERDDGVDEHNGGGTAKFQSADKQADDGPENEREHAGDRERPEHAGEKADHSPEDDEAENDERGGAADGGEGEGEADRATLARVEKGRCRFAGHGETMERQNGG
jgi:hypothetical protein